MVPEEGVSGWEGLGPDGVGTVGVGAAWVCELDWGGVSGGAEGLRELGGRGVPGGGLVGHSDIGGVVPFGWGGPKYLFCNC